MNDVFKACNFIRGTMDSRYYYETIVALAYVKLSAISNGHKAPTSLDELRESISAINDEDTAMFIGEVLLNRKQLETNRDFEPLVNALPVSVDALKEIILHASINSRGSFAEGTPETLSNLAVELLNIDKNDEVADFGTGTGTFLVKAAEKHPCKLYYACDVNTSAVGIARMRASLLDVETIVEQKDMFQVDRKFNKIFSNYPFALSSYGGKV
jgi:16S rRNA G1207 methylase RsmC